VPPHLNKWWERHSSNHPAGEHTTHHVIHILSLSFTWAKINTTHLISHPTMWYPWGLSTLGEIIICAVEKKYGEYKTHQITPDKQMRRRGSPSSSLDNWDVLLSCQGQHEQGACTTRFAKCLGFRGSAMSSQFGLNRVHIGTAVR
jgi:hypothetical protein